MKTTINKQFYIKEPLETVWRYLIDPEEIVTCVPGASLTERIDDKNFIGEITVNFGLLKAKAAGQITFAEIEYEQKRIRLLGKKLDAEKNDKVEMLMDGLLTEKEGITIAKFSIEVTLTEMLMKLGSRLIDEVSDSIVDQFVKNLKDKIAGKEVDNRMRTGSMMGSVIKGFFKRK